MFRETFEFLADYSAVPRCMLCPHRCTLRDGTRGICAVRGAEHGRIGTYNYGALSSMAVDPIEKKPLYHFHPGEEILSLGSIGCNLSCPFCQNHHISQQPFPDTEELSIDDLLSAASGHRMAAFTYNEPVIWYEFVFDAAQALHRNGIAVVLVTNGFINEGPLRELLPFVDAMNIDLKGDDAFYRDHAKGDASAVRRTIACAAEHCHVEVTTLAVTGVSDSEDVIDGIARFIASIRKTIPLHLSAYRPMYRYREAATDDGTLIALTRIAKKHLSYVYTGNTRAGDHDTFCPRCGHTLIARDGYRISLPGIREGACIHCGYDVRADIVL